MLGTWYGPEKFPTKFHIFPFIIFSDSRDMIFNCRDPNQVSKKLFNSLASGYFREFSEKKRLKTHGFAQEYLRSCWGYGPGWSVGRRNKSSSLHTEKFFLLGMCGFFVSDVISGGLLGHFGPLCLALAPTVRW